MSDLAGDMGERVQAARADGREVRGWVGFHRQDVERVVEAGVLCVAYAPVGADDDAAYVTVATEAAVSLTAAGLTVEWSGNPDKRIEVTGVRWQRRRRR